MPIFNPTTIVGTSGQVLANGNVGTVEAGSITLTLPQSIATTSTPTFSTLTLSGLTPNSFLYPTTAGLITSTTAATNGQLLIGSTGVAPVKASLTAGTGISVTPGAGSISLANTGVLSFSAGTTGLTPSTTTTGAITLAGTLIAVNGGTGFNTYVVGDILFANTTSTLARLADVATGNALISGGIGVAPSYGKIGLTTHVSGILPIANGGTATSTVPANNQFLVGNGTGYTVRTISLLQNDLSDVVLTAPSSGQVLAFNSGTSKWNNSSVLAGNASGTVGVSPTGGGTAWTLVSGNRYRADFVHNLGTTNVVVTLWDTNNNAVVIADSLITTDANTVRLTVVGNTKTIKVVVIAQGSALVAGGSTPSSVITAYEGVTVSTAATRLNFRGQAVGVTDAGAGTTNITVGSRFTYFASSLDTPVNSDFAVNAIAATVTDPTYASLNVRSFSNSTEQGVATLISIPSGATTLTIKMRGRPQTAPGVASVVQPRLYYRLLPNNSAVGAWSAAQELANISIPTNANFQYSTQTILLSTLGLVAGNLYQIELTRRVTGVTGTNLAANYLLAELTLELA